MTSKKPSPRDRAESPASGHKGKSGYAEEQPDDKADAQQPPRKPQPQPQPDESDVPDDSELPVGPASGSH